MSAPSSAPMSDVSGTVYGVRLRGPLPDGFRSYLRQPAGAGPAIDVTYRPVQEIPAVQPIWEAEPGPRLAGRMALFRRAGGFGLRVESDGRGLFHVGREAIAIEWLRGTPGAARCFFSYALPLWLESTGVPVLHASAVSLGDRAVAFIGPSGIGKSTLCAGLLRTGCRFLADDGLPLFEEDSGDWRCAPGPPWLRLWPSALERRLGIAAGDLPRVQDSLDKRMLACPAAGAEGGPARPRLGAIYLLDGLTPGSQDVAMTACTARDSLLRLIEHSLAGAPVAALGWSARRLRLLSRLATRTPVRRLTYPAGDVSWQRVHQAIEDDLTATARGLPGRG